MSEKLSGHEKLKNTLTATIQNERKKPTRAELNEMISEASTNYQEETEKKIENSEPVIAIKLAQGLKTHRDKNVPIIERYNNSSLTKEEERKKKAAVNRRKARKELEEKIVLAAKEGKVDEAEARKVILDEVFGGEIREEKAIQVAIAAAPETLGKNLSLEETQEILIKKAEDTPGAISNPPTPEEVSHLKSIANSLVTREKTALLHQDRTESHTKEVLDFFNNLPKDDKEMINNLVSKELKKIGLLESDPGYQKYYNNYVIEILSDDIIARHGRKGRFDGELAKSFKKTQKKMRSILGTTKSVLGSGILTATAGIITGTAYGIYKGFEKTYNGAISGSKKILNYVFQWDKRYFK